MSRMVIQQKQCRVFGTILYLYLLLKVMNPSGKQNGRNVSHIVIVLGGSPAKNPPNPPLILLCADTTVGGMWSPLTLTALVAVTFSIFSPGSFPSDVLSIGSHVFRKIVWNC